MSDYEFIRFDVSDHVATVTLARPPVNALNLQLCQEIGRVFADVNRQVDQVRAVILTGDGTRFCAGRDNKVADLEPPTERMAARTGAMSAVFLCEVPVIAAVNGAAIGAGFRLALLSDMALASSGATFAMPELDFGLNPSIATLLRGFNQYQAREIAFTGARYSADDMCRMGFLRSVETQEGLLPEARRLAAVLAAKSPVALRGAKWSANEVELMFRDWEAANRRIEARA